ncbi:MAG: hypothetical protein KY464_18440 [Gemmatimonadetes bacterium]|nr:hypothetical protein [Gemmatimonadota bacterium]
MSRSLALAAWLATALPLQGQDATPAPRPTAPAAANRPTLVADIPVNYDEPQRATGATPSPIRSLRRHRPRLRQWRRPGRARHVPQAGPDGARARRVGLHLRLVVGAEPRAGLSPDRPAGESSLRTTTLPAPNVPIINTLGYFMHAGGHGVLPTDWPVYLRFMRMHFLREK